jgi:acyl carrier protein
MSRGDIEQELVEICSAVLEHPVTASVARGNDAGWDSLRHMQIVFAVEEKFDLQFSEDEIFRLDSIAKFADLLEQRNPA